MSAHPARSTGGFTITELIGVLAIVAVLMSIAVPAIFQKIEGAYMEKERGDLPSVGSALLRQILETKSLPGDDWESQVANDLGVPLARVTHSATGFSRLLLVDPELHIGAGSAAPPYRQTSDGSPALPEHPRLMLVSSHRLKLPEQLSAEPLSASVFNSIWELSDGELPAGWPSSWAGHGDRLFVFRLDLTPYFYRLIVDNLSPSLPAVLSIDDEAPFAITEEGWSSYYFKDTVIGLYRDGALETRDLLTESRSYVYEHGVWRGIIRDGKPNPADFVSALETFRNAPLNQACPPEFDQQAVIAAYHQFALTFAAWAQAGFPDSASPEYLAMSQSRDRLQLATHTLITP